MTPPRKAALVTVIVTAGAASLATVEAPATERVELVAVAGPGTENDEDSLLAHVRELERMTADGGVLIASDARYAAEDGGQTHYGQFFEMIPGRMSARGCLSGERDGAVVGVYWYFFTGWDPVEQKAFFYQTGSTGYAGMGYGGWAEDGTHWVEQRFVGEGMTPRLRHESRWLGTDSLAMRSFEADLNGQWRPRREYMWVRAERTPPCASGGRGSSSPGAGR